jgi:redox-sensing transcriptional repressor
MTKPRQQIPKATVTRLAFYLRELQQMQRSGLANIQSRAIAERLGLNDSQVRRDISCLGTVGQRGVGYQVEDLIQSIQSILGTDRIWKVILVGVGNLGRALSGYRGFQEQGFDLLGAFDADAEKIDVSHLGLTTGASIKTIDRPLQGSTSDTGRTVQFDYLGRTIIADASTGTCSITVGGTALTGFASVAYTVNASTLTLVTNDAIRGQATVRLARV